MRRIPDEQVSVVTVSVHMEVDKPKSTTTHTCAPVHILTEAHRDVATPSPSYTHTHKRFWQRRKEKLGYLHSEHVIIPQPLALGSF